MNVEISQPQVQYPLKLPLDKSWTYFWMVSNYLFVTVHTDMFSEDIIPRSPQLVINSENK